MEDRDSVQEDGYDASSSSAPPSTPIYRGTQLSDPALAASSSSLKVPFGGTSFNLPTSHGLQIGKPFTNESSGKGHSVTFAPDSFGQGSDRKRSRRALYEEGTLDDIMGQSKFCSVVLGS